MDEYKTVSRDSSVVESGDAAYKKYSKTLRVLPPVCRIHSAFLTTSFSRQRILFSDADYLYRSHFGMSTPLTYRIERCFGALRK